MWRLSCELAWKTAAARSMMASLSLRVAKAAPLLMVAATSFDDLSAAVVGGG
jgi:hypothetical protein